MPKTDGALFRTENRRAKAGLGLAANSRFVALDHKSPRAMDQPAVTAAPIDRSFLVRSTVARRPQVQDERFAAWDAERPDLADLGLEDRN